MSAVAETRLTLFDHLGLLELVAQAEESPEQAEFLTAEISAQIAAGARDKIESIYRLLAQCDATDVAINAEQKRLSERAGQVDTIRQRVRDMVTRAMQAHRIKAIEGETCKFSLRKSPASVLIDDVAAVPDEFKRVTINMPAARWQEILAEWGNISVWDSQIDCKTSVVKAAVKKAIDAGQDVPGADMTFGAEYLVVK
jgi:hypothetical protein